MSVDLGYFTSEEFEPDKLADTFDPDETSILSIAKNSLSIVSHGVKIDLLRHAYADIAPIDTIAGQRLVSLPDLAAMKLNAIANRGSKKDFYDMAELLRHHSLDEMLGFFSVKYPATDPFAVIRSLVWFGDAELEPDPIPLGGQTWEDTKHRMIHAVRGL